MKCDHCKRVIEPRDLDQNVSGGHLHYFCSFRMIAGSVGHQMKLCSCYGGDKGDPENLSVKEAAIAAYYFYQGAHQPTAPPHWSKIPTSFIKHS